MSHDNKIPSYLQEIQSLLNPRFQLNKQSDDKHECLIYACNIIAEKLNIRLEFSKLESIEGIEEKMANIAMVSDVNIRKVQLKDKWWEYDCGLMLAFIDGVACVLSGNRHGGYHLINLASNRQFNIKQDKIDDYAFVFTKPLPNKMVGIKNVVKSILPSLVGNIKFAFYLQLVLTSLTLFIPIVMGYFFDNITSLSKTNFTGQLASVLIINTLIYCLFSINQTLLLIYIRFKLQSTLVPAVWDRVLRLPLKFFSDYHAGDLAYRVGAFTSIQEILTQSSILSILGLMVSLLSFFLMLFYDVYLALFALVCVLIIALIFFISNFKLLKYKRKSYDYLTEQAGFVFQVITGIIKVKVSGNEYTAFTLWSKLFTKLMKLKFNAGKIQVFLRMINGVALIFMTLCVFVLYYYQANRMSVGDFVAFNTAFSLFFTSFLTFTLFISTLIEVIPLFEKINVIFKHQVASTPSSKNFIALDGNVSVKDLSFRYDDDQNLILKKFNCTIMSGEVIGFTGESGCGKSTLFRIMLGLEKQNEGSIYYDNINMNLLNPKILRQQVGLVSQKSKLIPGTILDNLIGNSSNLNRQDAWKIIYELGLEDMIRALPMELDTFINEGLQTLSGGEVQRIILARALIKRPKILFLDEATSSLDSENQRKIQKYLKKLSITQLIIAHRLSTLQNADRIIVIENGEISQMGNFEELIAKQGYFSQLVKNQFS